MASTTRKKTAKGTVAIGVLRSSLFLRWQHEGKRYTLYLGLPDSSVNRQVAQGKAHKIEWDMRAGHFDKTLKAYKPSTNRSTNKLTVVALFKKFMAYKAETLSPVTIRNEYQATHQYLEAFFEDKSAQAVGPDDAANFVDWFRTQKLTPYSVRKRLVLISSAWNWAIKKELVESNPWTDLAKRIKVPPKQQVRPFSREEIGAIIKAFQTDRYYAIYADYVQFLFGTGCRTSEAIGLQWKHLSADCSLVWIGETLTRGKRQSTKTNRARTITLTNSLRDMLMQRRPINWGKEDLVFTGPKGRAVDDHNFRNRGWVKILSRLEIDYRKPYTTRATLISHALDLGKSPLEVAQLTGHDLQVLYKHYAGNVNSRPRLPELSTSEQDEE
jgi:integrase